MGKLKLKVEKTADGKHKIDFGELIGIIGKGGKIVFDLAKFADGVTPDEISALLVDIDALRDAVEEALED